MIFGLIGFYLNLLCDFSWKVQSSSRLNYFVDISYAFRTHFVRSGRNCVRSSYAFRTFVHISSAFRTHFAPTSHPHQAGQHETHTAALCPHFAPVLYPFRTLFAPHHAGTGETHTRLLVLCTPTLHPFCTPISHPHQAGTGEMRMWLNAHPGVHAFSGEQHFFDRWCTLHPY